MIVVVVNHWCKPGMLEAARRRIDRNGDAMAAAPGFLFRYRIERPEEPDRVATVTGWAEEAAYRAYRAELAARDAASSEPSPYERAVNEVFVARSVHGDLPAGMLAI